ncbi:N-acetylneuraminate epimerase [Pasteurella testudinis]|uniref:N-acetylneuraminate epimerase n=1 Tax=Pasteurella testudinis TaxID=761 RepID=UPI0040585A47
MTRFPKTAFRSCLAFALLASAGVAQAGTYPDLPEPIKFGSGALLGETVYVGLGSAGDRFYRLDLGRKKAEWQAIAEFPGGNRLYAVAAALNGELYIFGGLQQTEDGLYIVNDAYRYVPQEDRWIALDTRAPRGIVGAGAVVYQDKIYLLGGNNPEVLGGYLQAYAGAADQTAQEAVKQAYFEQRPQDYFFTAELLSYQAAENRWRNEGKFPFSARTCASVIGQGETVLVVNGAVKPGLNTANTQQGRLGKPRTEWKKLPDLPAVGEKTQEGLSGAGGGYSHGYYLVAGGTNFPGAQQQFQQGKLFAHEGLSQAWHDEIYTLKNGRWKMIGELNAASSHAVAVSYDNKVLLIGGESHGGKALSAVQVLSYDGSKLIIE